MFLLSFIKKGDDGLLPIDGQNGFPGQLGAVGPRGIPGVPGCNGSKVKKIWRNDLNRTSLYAYLPLIQ